MKFGGTSKESVARCVGGVWILLGLLGGIYGKEAVA